MTKNSDRKIVLLLLAITLLFRIWTIMMIHTGVDERDYWYSAKSLTLGIEYPQLNHRTVRWGVIIPVAAMQTVTGVSANMYYVLPVLNSLVQSLLLYLLGKKIKNRKTGFLAALMLIFFPYQIRSASQVRPEIFSITYILLTLYFLFDYFESRERKKEIRSLIFAGIFLFIAYITKITNLYFFPSFIFLIAVYRRKVWIRESLIFCGVLFVPFFFETVIYNVLGGYRFGQLSVIIANHVEDMIILKSWTDIFQRYSLANLQLYWDIPLVLFIILTVYTFLKSRKIELIILIVPVLTFLFFITFTVSSIHPLKMAEPFVNRYFSVILAPVFLVIAWYLDEWFSENHMIKQVSKNAMLICSGSMLIFMVVFSLPFIPEGIKIFIHSPMDRQAHPFWLNIEFTNEINDAWSKEIPIVAVNSNAGKNALYTASWYYLDSRYYVEGRPPQPTAIKIAGINGFISLDGTKLTGTGSFLAAIRSPFRVQYMNTEKLSGLGPESFER